MAVRKKKSLVDQASDYVDKTRPQVEAAVATALEAVEDFVENTAKPALADARDKAGPALADAKDKAAPVVAAGAAGAAKASAKAAEQSKKLAKDAKDAADAQVAKAKGEPKKKGGKLKKVAIFAALAGAAAFVAKKLQGGGKGADNWQSSYVPTPAPTPNATTTSTTAPAKKAPAKKAAANKTTDTGGSAPGEAIADNAEEPHEATSPDDPAEVVDVGASEDANK